MRLTFIAILFVFLPLCARAEYSVAPLVIDTQAVARDTITKTITITNIGSTPLTIFPTVNNISVDAGGTIQQFLPPVMSDRTTSLAAWIEINRGMLVVPAGATKTIDMTLHIDPAPKPGTYHAFVGFGNGLNSDEAAAAVARGGVPGTMVTVTIADKTREVLKLAKFFIDRIITSNTNQAAVYTVTNPGDQPLTPTGDIIFYDSRGNEVSSVTVNAEQVVIPPGAEHTFNITVPTQGLFGKYKALLSVEYGSKQVASLQDTVFFYVLPLKISLVILGIILVLAIIIALYVHHRYLKAGHDHDDDSKYLSFHIRDSHTREEHEHDIDLTKS